MWKITYIKVAYFLFALRWFDVSVDGLELFKWVVLSGGLSGRATNWPNGSVNSTKSLISPKLPQGSCRLFFFNSSSHSLSPNVYRNHPWQQWRIQREDRGDPYPSAFPKGFFWLLVWGWILASTVSSIIAQLVGLFFWLYIIEFCHLSKFMAHSTI